MFCQHVSFDSTFVAAFVATQVTREVFQFQMNRFDVMLYSIRCTVSAAYLTKFFSFKKLFFHFTDICPVLTLNVAKMLLIFVLLTKRFICKRFLTETATKFLFRDNFFDFIHVGVVASAKVVIKRKEIFIIIIILELDFQTADR